MKSPQKTIHITIKLANQVKYTCKHHTRVCKQFVSCSSVQPNHRCIHSVPLLALVHVLNNTFTCTCIWYVPISNLGLALMLDDQL